jgi:hypothetical protein
VPPEGEPQWAGFGQSIRGAAHRRKGLSNQDHLRLFPRASSQMGPPLVCAVADGHGSPRSFRSAKGADFATRCARDTLWRFQKESSGLPENADLLKALVNDLPRDLVLAWRKAVEQDLERYPLSDDELTRLEEAAGAGAYRQVQDNPYLIYGATLLVVLVTTHGLAFLQLGDGDILLVAENGATHRPLPRDARLMGNETTSLCGHEAWRDFRTGWLPFTQPAPALVLLSTDGYCNSFHDDAAFLQVGADLLGLLRSEGAGSVCRSLGGWLEESSQEGSGDDITLAVLYRCAAIQSSAGRGRALQTTGSCQSTADALEPEETSHE